MKNQFYICIIWLVVFAGINISGLHAQDLEWARTFGGNTKDEAFSVFVDDSGNVYTTGSFQYTVDFDPGLGVELRNSNGSNDVFVLKLDPNGAFIWVSTFGGDGNDVGTSISGDNSGNIFVTGFFEGQASFPSIYCFGEIIQSSAGGSDVFLMQFDADGDSYWQQFYGGVSHDKGFDVKVDGYGDVIATGVFQGTVDFSNGIETLISSGSIDVFVIKLNNLGEFKWSKSFGSFGYDGGESISTDAQGNVFIGGYFNGTVDFDPGPGIVNLNSAGGSDYFVLKLDLTGNYIWVRCFGDNLDNQNSSICVDDSGNTFALGVFSSIMDVDPGLGVFNLISQGGRDVFIQKLDPSGSFLWAKSFGGMANETGEMISLNHSGNIIAAGTFFGEVDLDPGIDMESYYSNGESDFYVLELDSNGEFSMAHSYGGPGWEVCKSFYIDDVGNLIGVGNFQQKVDFDSGSGISNLSALGQDDIFIQKIDSTGIYQWVRSVGGTSDDKIHSVGYDHLGNIYVTGDFQGYVDFEPGTGITAQTSTGYSDVFLQKLDASGNLQWVKSVGGKSKDVCNSVIVDGYGNSYISGSFEKEVDFNYGVGNAIFESKGKGDAFVMKVSSTGSFIWARTFGGSGIDESLSLFADASGSIYFTGYFQDTIGFYPCTSIDPIVSSGGNDVFVGKMDVNGNFQWVKSFGGELNDVGNDIRVDADGNIYFLGTFEDQVDFNPGNGSDILVSNGFKDVFLVKLDGSGNFLWAKSFGSSQSDSVNSFFLDVFGNIYISGSFQNTMDADPGNTVSMLNSTGGSDIFIQKLDYNGNFLWANSIGGVNDDQINSIYVDDLENIYVTGYFQDTVDFDPGSSVANLYSLGGSDCFIQKLSSDGSFLWAYSFGGKGQDFGTSLSVDGTNNIYSVGYFEDTINLDPGFQQNNFISNGGSDFFVQKLRQTVSGIPNLNSGIEVLAYPNPSNGLVQIVFDADIKDTHIVLYDVQGNVVFEKEIISSYNESIFIEGASGVYFLHIISGETSGIIKLIKE